MYEQENVNYTLTILPLNETRDFVGERNADLTDIYLLCSVSAWFNTSGGTIIAENVCIIVVKGLIYIVSDMKRKSDRLEWDKET